MANLDKKKKIKNVNLARLCARLKPVFLSKKGPSRARLLTKMSPSEELGTLRKAGILCLDQPSPDTKCHNRIKGEENWAEVGGWPPTVSLAASNSALHHTRVTPESFTHRSQRTQLCVDPYNSTSPCPQLMPSHAVLLTTEEP